MCRAPRVSPYLTYKSCWRLNLGWGSAWRCVCLADDGVEKWIAASLSFKCTYSRAPAAVAEGCSRASHWIQSPGGISLASRDSASLSCIKISLMFIFFLNIQSRCFIFTVVNRHLKYQKLDMRLCQIRFFWGGKSYVLKSVISTLSSYVQSSYVQPDTSPCTWSVYRFCLKLPDWLKWCERNVSGEISAFHPWLLM